MVFLQEFFVMFGKVSSGGKNWVKFGSDDFLNFAIRWFSLCTEDVCKTGGLFVGSRVRGREGVGC